MDHRKVENIIKMREMETVITKSIYRLSKQASIMVKQAAVQLQKCRPTVNTVGVQWKVYIEISQRVASKFAKRTPNF